MSTVTPTRGLIDTPILIAYREGQPDAVQFVMDLRSIGQSPELSQLSAMVLFAWCQNAGERMGVDAFLLPAVVHPITARIIRRAYRILESLPPPCALTADDAIVAATAIEHNLPLYTLDLPKFAAVAGLSVLQPY